MFVIDFETRSKVDLRKYGALKYSKDPSTEILCLGYKDVDGLETKLWTLGDSTGIDTLLDFVSHGGEIQAHNSFFEYCIWNNIMVPRYNFPKLSLDQLYCTQSRALYCSMPASLEKVGEFLDLDIQKDKEGHRIMLQMCKPRKPSKKNKSIWFDDKERRAKLYSYCKDDVNTEKLVHDKLPDLPKREREIFLLDQKINLRGIPIDLELAEKALSFVNLHSDILNKELLELTNGSVNTAGQVKEIIGFLNYEGYDVPNLQANTVREWVEKAEGRAKRVLEIRRDLNKSSVKKLKKMVSMSQDNRLNGLFQYHGAHSGRWAGRSVQPQNFPRGKDPEPILKDLANMDYYEFRNKYNVLDAISDSIRGFIKAPEDKLFVCSDFSSIETRMLFWLADETLGLEVFKGDGKIYEQMGARIKGCDPKDIAEDSRERQLGKMAILSLGYGAGAPKFKDMCEGYDILISEEESRHIVKTYRSTYASVVDMWYKMEFSAKKAVEMPGKVFSCNKVDWLCKNNRLMCKLPSGKLLFYNSPDIEKGGFRGKTQLTYLQYNSMVKKVERHRTYGGKIVENLTQSVARDALADAMLRIEPEFPIVLHAHDEVMSLVDVDKANLDRFNELMLDSAEWCKDCLMGVKGWIGERYKK